MIEVECKLKINNTNLIEEKLQSLGFVFFDEVIEIDTYFDNEKSNIKNSDSALRIRTTKNMITNSVISEINFKGPKLDTVSVSRTEYETTVTDADVIEKILNSLGYFSVKPLVRKTRKSYKLDSMTACLDSVDGLGNFLELELIVEDVSDKDAALLQIEAILDKLGYSMSDTTTMSYLSMLIVLNGC